MDLCQFRSDFFEIKNLIISFVYGNEGDFALVWSGSQIHYNFISASTKWIKFFFLLKVAKIDKVYGWITVKLERNIK